MGKPVMLTDPGTGVRTYDDCEHNFVLKHQFAKYLKRISGSGSDKHFLMKYSPKDEL